VFSAAQLAVQRDAALAWLAAYFAERRVARLDERERENRLLIDTLDARIASGQAMPAERTMAREDALPESAYAAAKGKCDDQAGNATDVCVKEAKAVETKALADAKIADICHCVCGRVQQFVCLSTIETQSPPPPLDLGHSTAARCREMCA
jgi:hypothetical protein